MHDLARRARTMAQKSHSQKYDTVKDYVDHIGLNALPHENVKYMISDSQALARDWMYAIYDFNTAWNQVTCPENLPTPTNYRATMASKHRR